jgi:hypothetical protein
MFGPIDYVVIGFEGNNFDGSILRELSSAIDDGVIRVIDLLFVMKDEDGTVTEGEYEDQSEDVQEMLRTLHYDKETGMPLVTDRDIAKISKLLDNNTAAGVLIVEHLWAKGLKKALLEAGVTLLTDGRIHTDAINTAVKELETTAA